MTALKQYRCDICGTVEAIPVDRFIKKLERTESEGTVSEKDICMSCEEAFVEFIEDEGKKYKSQD